MGKLKIRGQKFFFRCVKEKIQKKTYSSKCKFSEVLMLLSQKYLLSVLLCQFHKLLPAIDCSNQTLHKVIGKTADGLRVFHRKMSQTGEFESLSRW